MACINPDGTLSPSAKAVVMALQSASTLPALAQMVNLPLYRLRSSLRELLEAEWLTEENGVYGLTDKARKQLEDLK